MPDHHPYHQLMLQAVEISRRGFGHTAPNPCVGALIVRDGIVLAEGWHNVYGGPHAERMALAEAREKGVELENCTMLVTLEPCNHHGKTPPCTEAILESGIRHVIIGAMDPNPKATGGAERLRLAGVAVENGVAERECLDNINDFIHFQQSNKRPYVILKLASTLDGRIATRSGHSQWISSPKSLKKVHWLRSRVQAVMVGAGTFYQDNPRLTARAEMLGHEVQEQPLAVIVSSRLPENFTKLEFAQNNLLFHLLRERPESTIFFTARDEAASSRAEALRGLGVWVYGLETADGGLNLEQGLELLRQKYNCYYILCEGGGRLGLNLLQHDLAQELLLFQAPKILGDNQAKPIFDGRAPERMDEAIKMRIADCRPSGDDLCIRFLNN